MDDFKNNIVPNVIGTFNNIFKGYDIKSVICILRAYNRLKDYGTLDKTYDQYDIFDKLLWLNCFDCNDLKSIVADKIKVHEYCKEKLGKDICTPIFKIYDDPSDINIDELPDQFVLKCNHGCGYNFIIKDKQKLNLYDCIKELRKYLNSVYSDGEELHYYQIERKCFAEKYLGDDIIDYKFQCINGKPLFCSTFRKINGEKSIATYDLNFKFIQFETDTNSCFNKPKNFDLMKEYCQILSKDFNNIRIDFYDIDETVYLGEMTLTSANCFPPSLVRNNDLADKVNKLLDIREQVEHMKKQIKIFEI